MTQRRQDAVRRRLVDESAMVCGVALVALSLAGCAGDAEPPVVKVSAGPASSAPRDVDAVEKAAVLAAYQGMTATEARSYATATIDPKLETYAAATALSDIKATVIYYQDHKTRMRGSVVRSPKVTMIDAKSVPLKAVVTDCADSSKYDEFTRAGKLVPVTGSAQRRHLVTSTAERSTSGPWKFYTYVIERDRTC